MSASPNEQRARLAQAHRARLLVEPLKLGGIVLRLPCPSDAREIYDGYARDVEAISWIGHDWLAIQG